MTAGTKRRPYRRDEILAAAVKLFHERGYHATGMDDIGAEAGISGPATTATSRARRRSSRSSARRRADWPRGRP